MLINRSKVKEFALEMAKHRAHTFTRVCRYFLKTAPIWCSLLSPEPAMPKLCGWLLHFKINNNNNYNRKERIHEQ